MMKKRRKLSTKRTKTVTVVRTRRTREVQPQYVGREKFTSEEPVDTEPTDRLWEQEEEDERQRQIE